MRVLLFVALIALVFANEVIVSHDLVESKFQWTKQDMLTAKPMDLIIVDLSKEDANLYSGEIQFASNNGTRENTTPGVYPYATAGRLFFSTPRGQSSCSASSVGNDIILTAGHCVSSGRGQYYTNLQFCPQHKDGDCPQGRYTGSKIVTFAKWHNGQDLGRDVAFVKMSAGLEAKVGSVVVATDLPRTQLCEAIGYPGNFQGGRRMIMSGPTNQMMGHTNRSPPTVKLASRMTYGSSGGPCKK